MSHIFDTLEVENDEFDEDKELARIKTPKTKVGEMYQIGRHRVICGDSTEQSVVQRLVGKERVSLIYSDPPYNISYDYDRGLGGRGNYGGHVDDSKSEADYESFLKKTIENALVVSKKDIHCFYWADQCGVGLLQKIYKGLGIENKRVCLWVKGSMNPTPGVAFNKCYESCVYGTVGRPYLSKEILNLTEIMNKEVGTGNQGLEDVQDILEYDASYNSVYDKNDNGSLIIHQDNTESNTSPIITISIGRPMKFITYELKDKNDFNIVDSKNTGYRIAINTVEGESLRLGLLNEKPKYGFFTPNRLLEYAKKIDNINNTNKKESEKTNLYSFVSEKLKEQFNNAEKKEQ
jgi:hypothetical protein